MSDDRLRVTISDPDQIRTIENGAEAVADEYDVELSTGRGRAAKGEISMAEAISEMAACYAPHEGAEGVDG